MITVSTLDPDIRDALSLKDYLAQLVHSRLSFGFYSTALLSEALLPVPIEGKMLLFQSSLRQLCEAFDG
jgi:hypothetical protein